MTQYLGIGIGAGLVSALLVGVLVKATPLAIFLYLLAPLPILIVGLGWSHRAALVAAVTGSLALALIVSPFLGLGFALYLALPVWWLAYLALLGRPGEDGSLEWYPTGRLLGWIAGSAALAFVAIAVVAAPSYDTFARQIREMSASIVRIQTDGPRRQAPPAGKAEEGARDDAAAPEPSQADPKEVTQAEVADALARIAPALATQGLALLLTFYLWAAARIVKISGRLPRPWPDIPSTRMPRAVVALLGLAVVLAFVPGYAGVLGMALGGSLTAAFALQGLAAFHDRSRGRPGRGALLFGLYLILFVTQGIALFALTLFGIADTVLDRRRPQGEPGRS
ncbi:MULTISPECIES: DUF2232 domain-containing protein [Methylobacterium]|uniref:DUF2232 domain-containing protein n=4 Tax=Pseudomonadota TaxID=1224 RepID=A0ABQ4SRI9_9HYPH|nr:MULTISPECIES: DUF2232 domain-containing protein [Methylobacterium]PIU06420.1 MAG: hypothetical protein COT56_09890 [Methylobacterium sp. CG09_land_8_20_14_0_10_71_15]PIU15836.1 MAG: hypothetical protein COT28_02825 [Methylobacterium sp. CG08_land_8_20_14_0_20_71_15]GBU18343.1 membrane protein [Methylobacterium sp.]GJE04921.1 hypothetical protein AOPFMNJM_0213 [Methylobacterium jeotgali]